MCVTYAQCTLVIFIIWHIVFNTLTFNIRPIPHLELPRPLTVVRSPQARPARRLPPVSTPCTAPHRPHRPPLWHGPAPGGGRSGGDARAPRPRRLLVNRDGSPFKRPAEVGRRPGLAGGGQDSSVAGGVHIGVTWRQEQWCKAVAKILVGKGTKKYR